MVVLKILGTLIILGLIVVVLTIITDLWFAFYDKRCFRCGGKTTYSHKEYNTATEEYEYFFQCSDCGCTERNTLRELLEKQFKKDLKR